MCGSQPEPILEFNMEANMLKTNNVIMIHHYLEYSEITMLECNALNGVLLNLPLPLFFNTPMFLLAEII